MVECMPRICKEGPELFHSLTKEMFKDVQIAWKITHVCVLIPFPLIVFVAPRTVHRTFQHRI